MMRFKKVYIEITNICNRNCTFCIKSKRNKREMQIEEFSNIIDEVKKYTDYIYLHVKGEPLLHSKFKEIIDVCDLKHMQVNITTNGTLISKKLDIIKNSKSIRQINISLHSYKQEDDYDSLFESIDDLNKSTDIYIVYRYWTINSKTDLKKDYSINRLINHYHFNEDMIRKIYNEDNIKVNETLYINKDEEFIWPSLSNSYYFEKGSCYGLKTHIGILSDGTVVPCCLDGEGIISLGNIFETSLKQILNKNRTLDIIAGFKQNKKVEELCKHCHFKK